MKHVWSLLEALSAAVFLAGALTMIIGGLGGWFYALVLLIMAWGWLAGLGMIVLSIAAYSRYEKIIRRPWETWCELWQWADNKIMDKAS